MVDNVYREHPSPDLPNGHDPSSSSSSDHVTHSTVSDELWCSSGNTVHFVDLTAWSGCGKMSISSHTSTQIHGIVAYSTNVIFISVHSTISIWEVKQQVCLSTHDCSSVFLPPPSPKSKNYQGLRMSIHSLFYHKESGTFWVGTSHGHVLIYEVGKLPEESQAQTDVLASASLKSTNQKALSASRDFLSANRDPLCRSRDSLLTHQEALSGSDEETSIAVLNEGSVDHTPASISPGDILANQGLGALARDFLSSDHKTAVTRDVASEEENSIAVLSDENGKHSDVMKRSSALETSLVMIPSNGESSSGTLDQSRDSLTQFDSFGGGGGGDILSSSPNISKFVLPSRARGPRPRTNTYNEVRYTIQVPSTENLIFLGTHRG